MTDQSNNRDLNKTTNSPGQINGQTSIELERSVIDDPDSFEDAITLAEQYFKTDQESRILTLLHPQKFDSVNVNPHQKNKFYFLLSFAQASSGKLAEAEQTCSEGLQVFPDSLDCYFVMTYVKLSFREFSTAVKCAKKFIELFKQVSTGKEKQIPLCSTKRYLSQIENMLGDSYRELNQVDDAIMHYNSAIRSDTNNPQPYISLALVQSHIGNLLEAQEIVKRGLSNCSECQELKIVQKALTDSNSVFQQAEELLKNGNLEEVDRMVQKIIDSSFDKTDKINETAKLFFNNGHYGRAAKYFWQNLNSSPNDPETLNNLADCYFELENFEKALEYYEMASELPDAPIVSFRNLGRTHFILKQYGSAIIALRKYIQIHPEDTKVLGQMADMYSKTGDFRAALPYYEKSLKSNPQDHTSFFKLSECYLNLGQKERAVEGYKKVLELNPDFEPAKKRLSQLEAVSKD